VIVTMLPAGKHVREVYEKDVLPNVAKGALLIDCSTIDVDSARHVGALAEKAGLEMVDAPVSGGVGGATAGTLTFMVGGGDAAFAKAKPILEKMGKNIVHAGASGNGQAAKICNNMILGVSMNRRQRRLHAGQAARAGCAEAVRRGLDLVGSVLVAHQLLPGAGARCRPRRPTATTRRASPRR